jgi:hypothetical protein
MTDAGLDGESRRVGDRRRRTEPLDRKFEVSSRDPDVFKKLVDQIDRETQLVGRDEFRDGVGEPALRIYRSGSEAADATIWARVC